VNGAVEVHEPDAKLKLIAGIVDHNVLGRHLPVRHILRVAEGESVCDLHGAQLGILDIQPVSWFVPQCLVHVPHSCELNDQVHARLTVQNVQATDDVWMFQHISQEAELAIYLLQITMH
jgi:hypothetical protein